jgi:hypothetical protein
MLEVPPFVVRRRWNVRPLPTVNSIAALAELSARVSRIITPHLAQRSVFWIAVMRT